MKTQFFTKYIWPEMSLLWHGEVFWFIYFKTFHDTYVLMDNFCPYFKNVLTPLRGLKSDHGIEIKVSACENQSANAIKSIL